MVRCHPQCGAGAPRAVPQESAGGRMVQDQGVLQPLGARDDVPSVRKKPRGSGRLGKKKSTGALPSNLISCCLNEER